LVAALLDGEIPGCNQCAFLTDKLIAIVFRKNIIINMINLIKTRLLLLLFLIPLLIDAQLIHQIKIIDGTGRPAFWGSVRIVGNTISEVGNLIPKKGEQIIDGKGLILAPGFIDAHSHHLHDVQKNTDALSTLNQGITTIVTGQDGSGFSMDTLAEMMNRIPVAINVAAYTGHTSLREDAMGENNVLRPALQDEIEKMKLVLERELKKGSLGLSTGLEYEQAFYSTRDEVMQLSKLTALLKGRYISHIRREDVAMEDEIDEIIEIGRTTKMPVQISHITLGKKSDWGTAKNVIEKLEQARKEGIEITTDVYPYTYWHSTLRVLFPARDYTNIKSAELAVSQLFDPSQSILGVFAPIPAYQGKTISEISKMINKSEAQTLMDLISIAGEFKLKNPDYPGNIETITAKSMYEDDVANFIAWPHAVICSDGNGTGTHPRGYGSFTRILGRYVREKKILTWEEAIHKMTGLTARHLGIQNRGIIQPGNFADLVLFNPETVIDRATIENGKALSEGIETVWVN
jgi:N-acyl-D-aspartate/D-glutamate deacylase